MKRIRLQIQVLPWQASVRDSTDAQAQQKEIKPWVQPEDPESTLQQLVDNITLRYGRIYVGRGPLRVKELQDFWGSTLDLSDRISDIFDDRAASGDNLTSVCKVLRYPPDEGELFNRNRFASLLPESAARPQKRPPPPLFHESERPLPSVEVENGVEQRGSKRRRIDGSHASRSPSRSGGNVQRESSRASFVQVADSQKARDKELDIHGFPSLRSAAPDQVDPVLKNTILDSPARSSREQSARHRSSKCASPEIPLSFKAHHPAAARRSTSATNIEKAPLETSVQEDGAPNQSLLTNGRAADSSEAANAVAVEGLKAKAGNSRRRSSGPEIYDDIETDTESLMERQTMFDARSRRTASKTPSRPFMPFKPLGNSASSAKSKTPAQEKPTIDTDLIANRAETVSASSTRRPNNGLPSRSPSLQARRNQPGTEAFSNQPPAKTSALLLEDSAADAVTDANSMGPMRVYCSSHVFPDLDLHEEPNSPNSRIQPPVVEPQDNDAGAIAPGENQVQQPPAAASEREDAATSDSGSESDSDKSKKSVRSSLVRKIENAAQKHSQSNGSFRDSSEEILFSPKRQTQNARNRKPQLNDEDTMPHTPSARQAPTSDASQVQVSAAKQKALKEQNLIVEAKRATSQADGEKALQAERTRAQKAANESIRDDRTRKAIGAEEDLAKAPHTNEEQSRNKRPRGDGRPVQANTAFNAPVTARATKVDPSKLGAISKLLADNSLTPSTQSEDASANGEAPSDKSGTPSTASRDRKTITPMWPGRSGSKPSSSGSSSNSLTSKQSADSLLRNAMKGATMRLNNSDSPSVRDKASIAKASSTRKPGTSTTQLTNGLSESNGITASSNNKTKQTLLKIPRDRKLKGRATDRSPSPIKTATKSTSSRLNDSDDDEDFSYLDEDEGSIAGPSSRTKAPSNLKPTKASQSASLPVGDAANSGPSLSTSSKGDTPTAEQMLGKESSEAKSAKSSSEASSTQETDPKRAEEDLAVISVPETNTSQSATPSVSVSRKSSTAFESESSQVDPALIRLSPDKSASQAERSTSRDSSITTTTASTASSTSATTPKPTTISTTNSTHPTSPTPSASPPPSLAATPTSAQRPPLASQHSPLFLTQQAATQQAQSPLAPTSPTLELKSTTTTQFLRKSPSRPKATKYPSLSALSRSARGQSPPPPAAAKKASSQVKAGSQPATALFEDSDDDEESSDSDSDSDSSSSDDGSATAKKVGKAGGGKGLLPGLKGVMKRMLSSQQ